MTVLVAYASKHGSTRGIAEAIGGRLLDRGVEAVVSPIRDVDGLESYEAIVIGSAVYLGAWMKEAVAFLESHAEALHRIPVWLFSSGPTAADEGLDLAVSAKHQRRLDALGARDHHLFRGALDPQTLSFLERRAVKAAKQPLGDFREWPDVERWADAIADAVAAPTGQA
ncbi:MAG TPA: flavodoxin domain-containing protein [Actinomycetota bacterium]|nr:flavodoxin domain-containing protein [Actinomycetota bacterium]